MPRQTGPNGVETGPGAVSAPSRPETPGVPERLTANASPRRPPVKASVNPLGAHWPNRPAEKTRASATVFDTRRGDDTRGFLVDDAAQVVRTDRHRDDRGRDAHRVG